MANQTVIEGATSFGTPNSGDSVFVLGGAAAITTNVDQSALANGLAIVEISRAFSGQLATAANPLYTEITTRLVYAARAGAAYFRCKTGADATPLVQVNTAGEFHFVVGGLVTRFEVANGPAKIWGPAAATNIRVSGSGHLTLIDDTSTDPTLIHLMGGGSVYTERGFATGINDGGGLTIDAGSNVIGALSCRGRGSTKLIESGTITALNCEGHVPDTSELINPLTITDVGINMLLPNAQAFLDHPLITFTNTPVRYVSDGRIW